MGRKRWLLPILISVMVALPAGAALASLSDSHTGAGTNSPVSSNIGGSLHHQPSLAYIMENVLSGRAENYSVSSYARTSPPEAGNDISPSFSPSSGQGSVVFNESGLPTNSSWYVVVDSTTYTSNSSSMFLSLPDGTYSYNSGTSLSYVPLSNGGSLEITGSPVFVNITFISRLSVKETLFLSNGTTINGNFVQGVSNSAPAGIIFDPANNYTYVVDSYSNSVDVVSHEGSVIARIGVGISPSMAVYDPFNGYIYVTNSGSNSVSVINPANEVTGTISVGQFPFGISYNPSNNDVYVANLFSGNVSIIAGNASSGQVGTVANVPLASGFLPFDSAYDSSTDSVYFTNLNGSNVASIKGSQLTGYQSVGGSPSMMAYDSSNGNMYVTDSQTSASTGYGYMSVIDGSGKVISNITIPGSVNPFGITYDPVRNLIYITDSNNNVLISFNPANNQFIDTVTVGSQPFGLVTGLSGNLVEVTDYGSGSVSFISYTGKVEPVTFRETGLTGNPVWYATVNSVTRFTNGSDIVFNEAPGNYSYTISSVTGYQNNNLSGHFTVSNAGLYIPVNFKKLYKASFIEAGLLPGTPWGFNLLGESHNSTSSHMYLMLANGTYSITPYARANAELPGTIIFRVSGSSTSVKVDFNLTYSVNIYETGKMPADSWSVDIGGILLTSSTGNVHTTLANGTYNYSVEAGDTYSITPSSGVILINGAPVSIDINFTKLYSVTFHESGIYSSTTWSVSFNGSVRESNSSTVSFSVPNGTYSYSAFTPAYYSLNDGNGAVSVDGNSLTVNLTYTRLFNLTIKETGLPLTSEWWVMISGHNHTGHDGAVNLIVANGSYSYSSPTPAGYFVKNGSGTIVVSGSNRTIIVSYDKLYTLKFTETGLPAGKSWMVMLNGSVTSSENSEIPFLVENGTYNFNATAGYGYVSNISTGSVHISGGNRSITLHFTSDVGYVTFSAVNLPPGADASVKFNGATYDVSSGNATIKALYGNYSYTASYAAFNETFSISGNFSLASSNITVKLVFPALYSITFVEHGLAEGGNWGVNFSGTDFTASGGSLLIYAPNGTYNFSISDSTGQNFYVNIRGDMGFEGDYVAETFSSVHAVGGNSSSVQAISVNGQNITVMINFNNSQHDGKDQKHHWYHDFRVLGSDISHFVSYVVTIIQYAVSNVTSSLKFQYFAGVPMSYHPLFI